MTRGIAGVASALVAWFLGATALNFLLRVSWPGTRARLDDADHVDSLHAADNSVVHPGLVLRDGQKKRGYTCA